MVKSHFNQNASRYVLAAIAVVALPTLLSLSFSEEAMFDFGAGKQAAAKLGFVVAPNEAAQFLSELKKFSAAHSFSFQSAVVRPDGKRYSILMSRKDVAISAVNALSDEEFSLYFYVDGRNGGDIETVRRLSNDLDRELKHWAKG